MSAQIAIASPVASPLPAIDAMATSILPPPTEPRFNVRTSLTHPLQVSAIFPQHVLRCPPSDPISGGPTNLALHPSPVPVVPVGPDLWDYLNSALVDENSSLFQATNNGTESDSAAASPLESQNGSANGSANGSSCTSSVERLNRGAHGNMLLSSCPGKKVRLEPCVDGLAQQRCPVRRELHIDMPRLHAMGVRAIVCCLYDEELARLGVPWEEYSRVASETGLDVIRIPMIEGGIPLDVRLLEDVMCEMHQRLVSGQNVLVHCRGGIGRAGVIASCYLLRFGWVRSAARVIQVLRARRSARAIETVAQETFLAAYDAWVRREATAATTAAAQQLHRQSQQDHQTKMLKSASAANSESSSEDARSELPPESVCA